MVHRIDEARRRMEDAALLAEEDPILREVVDSLADAPPARREAWREVLAENEDLRACLRDDVEVPQGLRERIRGIMDSSPRARATRRFRWILAAAALILAASAGVLLLRAGETASGGGPVIELARLAATDHAASPGMTVRAGDVDALSAGLGGKLPFEPDVPLPTPSAELLGGRVCSFSDRPLLYTCWRIAGEDGDVALYKVRREDFGLEAHLPRRELPVDGGESARARCRVGVWTDERFGYVLVRIDPPAGGL